MIYSDTMWIHVMYVCHVCIAVLFFVFLFFSLRRFNFFFFSQNTRLINHLHSDLDFQHIDSCRSSQRRRTAHPLHIHHSSSKDDLCYKWIPTFHDAPHTYSSSHSMSRKALALVVDQAAPRTKPLVLDHHSSPRALQSLVQSTSTTRRRERL